LIAVAVVEALAIGLLGLLVAGLLRSHAEILRQLHHLGGGLDLDAQPGGQVPVSLSRRGAASASELSASGLRARGERATPGPSAVASLRGEAPSGEVVAVALDREGSQTLLLFLSSGCGTCQPWWEGLRGGEHRKALPGARVAVVARDASEESPSLLAGMAPSDVTVVLSSAAWDAFEVPGSPYAVLVDGTSATVLGQGVARGWEQLGSLVSQHQADLGGRGAPGPGSPGGLDGRDRERRADAELLAAGIRPDHPSLRPEGTARRLHPDSASSSRARPEGASPSHPGRP